MEPVEFQPKISPVDPPNGRYSSKLDDKGRLKLPVPFQTYLSTLPEKGLFVTSIDRDTAQIYPILAWRENLKLLNEQKEHSEHAETVLFNAQDLGADAEMDSQGRITVNSELRQSLDMDGQALHLYWERGHINICTEAIYQQLRLAAIERAKVAAKSLKGAGLQ
jgi:MraZ protein